MAQRRMFSPDIVSSEEFLSMPVSSRELYFQLGMNADDDGFIQPKITMRIIGATEDDLKVLLAKRFLLSFKTGVVVIKHWLIHNMIRADRYKPTRFQEEKKQLRIKENKAYTELATTGLHSGNQLAPQVRLGKVRLGKVIDTAESEQSSHVPEVFKIFEALNPTINYGNKTQRKSAMNLLKRFGLDATLRLAKYAVSVQGLKYAPTITNPYQLETKLAELRIYNAKESNNSIPSL